MVYEPKGIIEKYLLFNNISYKHLINNNLKLLINTTYTPNLLQKHAFYKKPITSSQHPNTHSFLTPYTSLLPQS